MKGGDVCGEEERLIERDSVGYSCKNNEKQQDYSAYLHTC
jgi:hypothetical protein